MLGDSACEEQTSAATTNSPEQASSGDVPSIIEDASGSGDIISEPSTVVGTTTIAASTAVWGGSTATLVSLRRMSIGFRRDCDLPWNCRNWAA